MIWRLDRTGRVAVRIKLLGFVVMMVVFIRLDGCAGATVME